MTTTALPSSLGILTVPIPDPGATITDYCVGDPLRQKLGDFLQQAIRVGCNTAWQRFAGTTCNVVERVEVNDPNDNTFVTSKLPCLAVYRASRNRKPEILADDVKVRTSQIQVLWVPPPTVQHHRALRESFYQGVEAAVSEAVNRGRITGWVDTGDTDPKTTTEGSLIDARLGLLYPLAYGMSFSDEAITIEITGAPPRTYPALSMMFNVTELQTIGGTMYSNAVEATYETNTGTDPPEYEMDQNYP